VRDYRWSAVLTLSDLATSGGVSIGSTYLHRRRRGCETALAFRSQFDLVDRLIASPHFGQYSRIITLDESERLRSSC
jgi:hypothetical protein